MYIYRELVGIAFSVTTDRCGGSGFGNINLEHNACRDQIGRVARTTMASRHTSRHATDTATMILRQAYLGPKLSDLVMCIHRNICNGLWVAGIQAGVEVGVGVGWQT